MRPEMANSILHNPKNPQNMSPESFARFLELLSPDVEESARRYTRLHEKLIGFFTLRGISDPISAADETIDRAALKISTGTPVPDIGRYCLGIARNITKERLRRVHRENTAFLRFIETPANAADEQAERIQRLLKPCFEELAVEDRELLLAYCQVAQGRARSEHRRQMAASMKITLPALRIRVARLRAGLADCVKLRSEDYD
jgi:hypothetical protein